MIMIKKWVLILSLFLWMISCAKSPVPKFRTSNQIQNKLFYIKDVSETRCRIKTLSALDQGSNVSQAGQFITKLSESPSKDTKPFLINHLPRVDYTVQGADICKVLLKSSHVRLVAKPNSHYWVRFQIVDSYLKVFLIAKKVLDLPYQTTTQLIHYPSEGYAVPIGGYLITQGEVRKTKNIEEVEIPILDFFSNEDQPLKKINKKEGIQHILRGRSDSFIISALNEGMVPFQYKEKTDWFPKEYFEGVWYSGVSVTAVEPLLAQSGWARIISGSNLSGDSHSGKTYGQKIYFQFEKNYLKALNQNYQKQASQVNEPLPAEAEVLSLPIQHIDYHNTTKNPLLYKGLIEPVYTERSWDDRRYVKIDFSRVDHFFNKLMKSVLARYQNPINFKTNSVTTKTILIADNYFDFVVYDGAFEYRFSFLRKKDSGYQTKTIASTDNRFEYFNVPDKRIFTDPIQTSQVDYEKNIKIMRVQPNENHQIVLNFSNATPKDQKIRDIVREAISLWNQALEKADLSLRLFIDESKDVPIGDIRYHILNVIDDVSAKGLLGIAQMHTDDDTGEVVSSGSNVFISPIKNYLKRSITHFAYSKYDLLNYISQSQVSYTQPLNYGRSDSQFNQPFSQSYFDFLSLKHRMSSFLSMPIFEEPRTVDQLKEQTEGVNQNRIFALRALLDEENHSNLNWMEGLVDASQLNAFKINYALQTGQLMEGLSTKDVRLQLNQWVMEKWDLSNSSIAGGHLSKVLSIVCHFISHPLNDVVSFQKDVEKCVEKIYPIYALSTTVHEIGHSIFSLRHNFSGSSDSSNFYPNNEYQIHHLKPYFTFQSASKIKKSVKNYFPSVSSSVMDYIHLGDGEQWNPGPYDVAAIQYLYSDYVQDASSLEATSSKEFTRCSDYVADSNTYCSRFDMGSNPEKIALKEVEKLFYNMNQGFYQLSHDQSLDYEYSILKSIQRLMTIYYDWRKRLKIHTDHHYGVDVYSISEKEWSKVLQEIVRNGKKISASTEDRELLNFYRARNLIYHALSYIALIPNRYCVLQKADQPKKMTIIQNNLPSHNRFETKILLELSKVTEDWFMRNESETEGIFSCWNDNQKTTPHPVVERYIATHYPNFSLHKEIGHFLKPYEIPQNTPYVHEKYLYENRYRGTLFARWLSFATLSITGALFQSPYLDSSNQYILTMMNERDIEGAVKRLMLARATKGMFYSEKDFFTSLKRLKLEHLTPEKSAQILFNFPLVKDNKDPLLRDELIQTSKLKADEKTPYSRDDHHDVKFYQNFEQESSLLKQWMQLYAIGHLISGGHSLEEVLYRSNQFNFTNMDVSYSFTGQLLIKKALNYLDHQKNPLRAASSYFDFGDIYLSTKSNQSSVESVGGSVIKELAQNHVRQLLSSADIGKFFVETKTENQNLFKDSSSFSHNLLNGLSYMLTSQGSRLGRVYFMYAYVLALGLLESYDMAIHDAHYENKNELYEHAEEQIQDVVEVFNSLFGYARCPTIQLLNSVFYPTENTEQGRVKRSFKDGEELYKHLIRVQNAMYRHCPQGVYAKKGKMQALYAIQNQIIYDRQSVIQNSNAKSHSVLSQMGFDFFKNQLQEVFDNNRLENDIQSAQNKINDVTMMSQWMALLFRNQFPFSEDKQQMRQWLRGHRQLLIDTMPKLLLMYSSDRYFVGEMMWIVGQMYNSCIYGRRKDLCQLQVEKLMSYYFSRNMYGTNQALEFAFQEYARKRRPLVAGGMALSDLVHLKTGDVMDLAISEAVFSPQVLVDYLLYSRSWEPASNHLSELEAQKKLLFQLLPLSRINVVNSSLFYNAFSR